MRRSVVLVLCGTLVAACGDERHVRVVVEAADSVTEDIYSLATHVQLTTEDGEAVLQRDETLPAGAQSQGIDFPADFVVLLGDASGELLVTVSGRRADSAPIASGSARGDVPPGGDGEVATLHVVLEVGGPGAGACGDGFATIGEICYGPALARTSARPGRPAAADLDGDGLTDLVTVTGGDDPGRGLSVSRGRGSDVFEAPRSVLGPRVDGPGAADLALGDVNGDGLTDAVIASSGAEPPLLSLGRAEDPWFGLIAPMPDGGAQPGGLAPELADLDGDDDLDLVAVGTDSVWIAIGAGDGTFAPFSVGGIVGAWTAVPGELDGDEGLEIAVGADMTTVRILDTDGTTVLEGSTGGAGAFHALAVVDVDGTPPAEIVAGVGPELRLLHPENDTLVLDAAFTLERGRPIQVAAAQEPGGEPAVIVLEDEQGASDDYVPAVVWLTAGPGRTLTPSSRARVHCRNARLTAADLDGDTQSEALLGCDQNGIAIERRVDGVLEVPQKGPHTAGFNVGDFDGDGRPDVVTHWWSLSLMRRADDPNSVDNIEDVPESHGEEIGATLGDFTGDERDDLVSACTEFDWCGDEQLKRWTANVGGAFEVLPFLPLPAIANSVTLARTVPDQKLRIVVTMDDGQLLVVNGESGATEDEAAGAPFDAWRSAAGPLDDAPGDEVVVVGEDGRTVVFRGDGTGGLEDGEAIGTTQEPTGLAIGDTDGDGLAELVLTQNGSTNVQVLRVGASGAENAGSFAAGVAPRATSLIDVDGDGFTELVLGGDLAIEMWSIRGSAPVLRYAMVGLDSFSHGFAAFSLRADAAENEWVPPMLFALGRWDLDGDLSWQEYVMSWRPRP